MGTWKWQAKNCQNGISDFTQRRMEYARKKSGAGSGIPNDILCQECYGNLLLGPGITLKDGSTKTPSARQIELVKTPKVTGGVKPYAPLLHKKTDANANQTDTESKTQRKKILKAEKETAEREANGGMT